MKDNVDYREWVGPVLRVSFRLRLQGPTTARHLFSFNHSKKRLAFVRVGNKGEPMVIPPQPLQ